jgi:undecaprenyl-diphosphatase
VNGFDKPIFQAINGLGFPPLDWLFVLVSTPEFGLTTAALLALYFAWRRRWDAVWIVLAGTVAIVLSDSVGSRFLKHFFARTRPCFALPPQAVRLLVPIHNSGSMPSLHAANNTAGAVIGFLAEKRTAWVLFPLAMLVALSRIGVGVHWPTDLLAGFLWGGLCAAVGWGLLRLGRTAWLHWRAPKAERAGKTEPEASATR